LIDALWAHAKPEDAVEHIRGRHVEGHVEVIMFLRETTAWDPEESALRLIVRTYSSSACIRTTFSLSRCS
jgi:hypothetical protein